MHSTSLASARPADRLAIDSGIAHKVNRMSDTTVKQQALNAVQSLPDSATFEDVLEQLLFISKVERGLAEADAGQLIPHEQVKARFGL